MAVYPKIDSPCPYVDRLGEVVQGGFCSMCKRDVHDLSAMDDAARLTFLGSCGTQETCVSYRIPRSLAAAMIAASAVAAMPAAAQGTSPAPTPAPAASPAPAPAIDEDDVLIVSAGRIARPIDRALPVVALPMPAPVDRDRRRPEPGQR